MKLKIDPLTFTATFATPKTSPLIDLLTITDVTIIAAPPLYIRANEHHPPDTYPYISIGYNMVKK
jgi:hypothetical protein